jgi:hypothetical protein
VPNPYSRRSRLRRPISSPARSARRASKVTNQVTRAEKAPERAAARAERLPLSWLAALWGRQGTRP